MLTAAVSGSFHRHMGAITDAVHELAALRVHVLSPADPRVVAQQGEFLFVASDRVRSVRLVQDRHLESIRAASFVWLVCPDGYVGQSASMEIGYAAGARVPIFSDRAPTDLTLREYVTVIPSLAEAVTRASSQPRRVSRGGILVDPHASIEKVHRTLDEVEGVFTRTSGLSASVREVHRGVASINLMLALPTDMQ
jgi:hypothetical protein